MSNEEDEYFKKQDLDKIAEARRAAQLASIRQQEQTSIQVALNTNKEVAAEALSLGFDGETARILPLVPLIQMAWIDGNVSKKERERLNTLAAGFGIQKDTPAGEFLEILINERPSDVFFGRVTQVVASMISEDPKFWKSESIIKLCREIAETSGSFFSLRDPINTEESDLLASFAAYFGVEDKTAGDIIISKGDASDEEQ